MKLLRHLPFAVALAFGFADGAQAQTIVPCAAVSACIIRAAPGALLDGYVSPGASAGYLFIFNSATAPTNGTVTAGTAPGSYQDCFPVAAATAQGFTTAGTSPETFNTGITLAFSSTGCGTLTLATPLLLKARTVQ